MEKKLDNTEADTFNLQGNLEQIEIEKEREIEKLKLELSNQCDQSTEHIKAKGKS